MDETKDDGIILGASRIEQMTQNLNALSNGPLPGNILDALDEAWTMAKPDCPPYFKYINN